MIDQEIKDRVNFKVTKGLAHETLDYAVEFHITTDDSRRDGTVQVFIGTEGQAEVLRRAGEDAGLYCSEQDCLEAAVFFKKLAKKIRARRPE